MPDLSAEHPGGTWTSVDEQRMGEAIALVHRHITRTAPNPRVGCVIYDVHGTLIASGVTNPPGGRHAEAQALHQAAQAGQSVKGATVYVTLEPCSHTGRSGPCVEALIAAEVSRICVGVIDPNPLVSGRGIKRLKAMGISVSVGVCKEACTRLHAPFFKWILTGRPWVSLKGAMTLDGCLATARGHSKWITGEAARTHVHQLRAQVDAVLVGGETARRDRPALTVRHCKGSNPIPVALSRRLSLPNDAPFLGEHALLIHGPDTPQERRAQLSALGATTIEIPYMENQNSQLNLGIMLDALGARGITHLCVEGGGHLHGSLLQAGLADDLHLYIAPRLIGRGKPLFNFSSVETIMDGWQLTEVHTESLGNDLYMYGRITHPDED